MVYSAPKPSLFELMYAFLEVLYGLCVASLTVQQKSLVITIEYAFIHDIPIWMKPGKDVPCVRKKSLCLSVVSPSRR